MNQSTTTTEYEAPQALLKRLQFLIDSVFALVMVIFVIILLPEPEIDKTSESPLLTLLAGEKQRLIQLVLIYLIVAMYWVGHTAQFKYILKVDTGQLVLQLMYLLGILFVPATLWLTLVLGEERLSYVIHNANLIWLGVFSILAWKQATKNHNLVHPDLPDEVIQTVRREAFLEPIVMAIGIVAALVGGALWWGLTFSLLIIVPMIQKQMTKK